MTDFSLFHKLIYITYSCTDPEITLLTDSDVVVLSGNNVTLGCAPTDPTLEIRWAYYNEDGTTTVLSPNAQPTIVFDPPGLYHQITMINVTLMNSGTYSCEVVPSCTDPSPVTFNTTVIVVPGIVSTFTAAYYSCVACVT